MLSKRRLGLRIRLYILIVRPNLCRIWFSISLFYTRSTDLPVVVEVFPKQSFWIASESYPMHHTHSHRNLEVAFFEALVYSADGM